MKKYSKKLYKGIFEQKRTFSKTPFSKIDFTGLTFLLQEGHSVISTSVLSAPIPPVVQLVVT